MEELEICGYYPGVIGKIVELHAVYYHYNWGFDISFESQVAREVGEFFASFVPERDGFWVAKFRGRFAGSVAIDGAGVESEGARLRWFIVAPEYQNRGIGTRLLNEAMGFCKEVGYRRVFLWTFKGLKVARRLYEKAGFRLTLEHEVRQWGGVIREQRFDWENPA